MCKTKHDIIVEPCMKKDDGILTYSDEQKKKNLHMIGIGLSQVNTSKYSQNLPSLIEKDMVRKSISKMKNRKAARQPSSLVSEIVKTVGEV